LAIIDIKNKKLLYKDKFKSAESDFYARSREIEIWLEDVIETFMPEFAILEEAFISPRTIKSNIPLLRLHGFIGGALIKRGIKLKTIAISSSRSFLQIKPNKKEAAFAWAQQNFPEAQLVDIKKDNDIADAIIIALNIYNETKIKDF
jgi:Holliday junction resolvasome RuvABC endonuclease subunit